MTFTDETWQAARCIILLWFAGGNLDRCQVVVFSYREVSLAAVDRKKVSNEIASHRKGRYPQFPQRFTGVLLGSGRCEAVAVLGMQVRSLSIVMNCVLCSEPGVRGAQPFRAPELH